MKAIQLINNIESILGQYKQTPFTNNFNLFLSCVNRSIESIIADAQPKELMHSCSFIPQDGVSDFLVWKPFYSEEATSLNDELRKLSIDEIDKLPTYSLEETDYRVASIQKKSTRREMQDACSSLYNGYIFTYDQNEFLSYCSRADTIIESQRFIRNKIFDISKSHSRYVRVLIYDLNASNPSSPIEDILFRSFVISQDIQAGGFSAILNNEDKTLTISASNIGAYRADIHSTFFSRSPNAFYIKGNRMYSNCDVQNFFKKDNPINIPAFIIPPILLIENQLVAKELYENKKLLDLLIYTSANEISKLLGFPQDDIENSYQKALNSYIEHTQTDSQGDYTSQTVGMY